MQRLPNPGSAPDEFINSFRGNYAGLKTMKKFQLDDITATMIANRAVTSQGAIGAEALKRSTRDDRSLDPLYNQSKMYAELYRTLGWMHSVAGALQFSFTPLGEAVATTSDPNPLVRECLLGISYPTDVLDTRSEHRVRVFAAIVKTMASLGQLTRDEIMAGPMSIGNDRDTAEISKMENMLAACRRRPGHLDRYLDGMAAKLGIKRKPSMENYTRFPMAFLPWSGWAEKPKPGTLVITKAGRDVAGVLAAGTDFRLEDFNELPAAARPSVIRFGFASMLSRSGINVDARYAPSASDNAIIKKLGLGENALYFSPFQQLNSETIAKYCPELIVAPAEPENAAAGPTTIPAPTWVPRSAHRTTLQASGDSTRVEFTGKVIQSVQLLAAIDKAGGNLEMAARSLAKLYEGSNQDVFYPLVADLLTATGLKCEASRRGVNAQRADAIIVDDEASIPIEIKSPGEETEISVKAVRQALENKIILLSRKGYPTKPEVTSLVVGYNLPNARSDVHELIGDIFTAYKINIGLVDIQTLFFLACFSVSNKKRIKYVNLRMLQGAAKLTFSK